MSDGHAAPESDNLVKNAAEKAGKLVSDRFASLEDRVKRLEQAVFGDDSKS